MHQTRPIRTRHQTTADPVVRGASCFALQRRCACGGIVGPDGECAACRAKRLATAQRAASPTGPALAPPIVHEVLRGGGRPLDATERIAMEARFGHDFSQVRIHTDGRAAESANAIDAAAYTVGRRIVFGPGNYRPATAEGRRLLAHELAHVVQQGAAEAPTGSGLPLGGQHDPEEREAERISSATRSTSPTLTTRAFPKAALRIRRQFITPLAAGGGYGGLMERDRQRTFGQASSGGAAAAAVAPSGVQVCARDLQGVLGYIGNHAYIEAPPFRYAIISPLCPASRWDNPVTGTTAQKWDNSPDPCGKAPTCVDCVPAPGVTDVARCMRDTFSSYNNPSLYRGLGPNSNTFAGTLARTCCAGMVPKPAALGNCPGWDDAPAPSRAGATPCPPGPTC